LWDKIGNSECGHAFPSNIMVSWVIKSDTCDLNINSRILSICCNVSEFGQMQPNQVLGTVLLKLDELSRQRFLCGVCLW